MNRPRRLPPSRPPKWREPFRRTGGYRATLLGRKKIARQFATKPLERSQFKPPTAPALYRQSPPAPLWEAVVILISAAISLSIVVAAVICIYELRPMGGLGGAPKEIRNAIFLLGLLMAAVTVYQINTAAFKLGHGVDLRVLWQRWHVAKPDPQLDSIEMIIRYALTADEYVDSVLLRSRSRRIANIFSATILLMTGLVSTLYDHQFGSRCVTVMFTIATLTGLVDLLFGSRGRLKKIWDKDPRLASPTEVRIYCDHFKTMTGRATISRAWSTFDRFSETRRLLVLWRGEDSLSMPKRALSREQLKTLRRLLVHRIRPLPSMAAPGGFEVRRAESPKVIAAPSSAQRSG